MKTPEGKWKDRVKDVLTRHDCYQYWPVPTGYGKRALDCFVCHYGRFLVVETKRVGKDLTPFQKITRDEMVAAGAIVLRVRDEGELQALEQTLSEIERPYRTVLAGG